MGIHTQLLFTLEHKTGIKLMLRHSSSTLVKYVIYPIVTSININEHYRSKRKFANKKNKSKQKKQGGIFISQNSFLHFFNTRMTKFKYSWILMKILEMIDKSQKKVAQIAAARCPK